MAINEQKQLEMIQDGFVGRVAFPGRAELGQKIHHSANEQEESRAGGINGTPQHL